MEIKSGIDLPPIKGRGRPFGVGKNLNLLNSLKHDQTVWDVPRRKMLSIIQSANRAGIKITVRRIPGSNKYAFKVNHDTKAQQDTNN